MTLCSSGSSRSVFARICRLAAVLGVVSSPSPGFAQSDAATISGRITDQTGQVLAGVHVRATGLDTGIESSTESGEEGVYVVRSLRPGAYRLPVRAPLSPVGRRPVAG
jgi:protocatechuate 3,4-dioxygenase beta subunit